VMFYQTKTIQFGFCRQM